MAPSPPQPHLNGAFYGPSTTTSYNRPSRTRGNAATCNPLTCLFSCICSCICNLIFQILFTLLIFLAVIGFIFWFIFRPNVPNFHVDDVSMTKFTLSDSNNTLYYNLAVNMTFRNPNKRLGIDYEKIEVNGVYNGVRFTNAEITPFYLGHKSEKNVSNVFSGEKVGVFGNEDKINKKYGDESKEGVYKIDLKMKLKMRFKVLWIKTWKFKPKFECDLKVPLSVKGKVEDGKKFERTKCDFDW